MPLTVNEKLADLKKVADEIPAVVIVHDIEKEIISYLSQRGLDILQIPGEELIGRSAAEYYQKYFNPDDIKDYQPKIYELMRGKDPNVWVTFFQQVRPSPKHEFKWYLTNTKIFHLNANGEPTHIISFACPLDPESHLTTKVNRLLEENEFLRKYHSVFATLTKREKEVLTAMARGEETVQIAKGLGISEMTVSTHRKNIRAKLGVNTNYEIMKFAQAFD